MSIASLQVVYEIRRGIHAGAIAVTVQGPDGTRAVRIRERAADSLDGLNAEMAAWLDKLAAEGIDVAKVRERWTEATAP